MKQLMGYLWGFALLIASIDFIASPEGAMRSAFKTARTPGPRFDPVHSVRSDVRPEDIGSAAEAARLRQEGLDTLERVRRMNEAN